MKNVDNYQIAKVQLQVFASRFLDFLSISSGVAYKSVVYKKSVYAGIHSVN